MPEAMKKWNPMPPMDRPRGSSLHTSAVDDTVDDGDGDNTALFTFLEKSTFKLWQTPGGYVQNAVLAEDAQRSFVDACNELGDFEMYAPCNRRFRDIRDTRRELQNLLEAANMGGMLDEDMVGWDEHAIMTPLPQDVIDAPDHLPGLVASDVGMLIDIIRTKQAQVRRAKAKGVFRDYTRLVEDTFASNDSDAVYHAGEKATGMPGFYRRGIGFCDVTEQNTRRTAAQALSARVVAEMNVMEQISQRRIQTGGLRKKALRIGKDDQYDNDE